MKRTLFAAALVVSAIAWAVLAIRLYTGHFPLVREDGGATSQRSSLAEKIWWTCEMHPWIKQDHPGPCPVCGMPLTPMKATPATAASAAADGSINIDPTVVQNMGVRTATVIREPLQVTIRTVGVLRVPEPAEFDVNPRVSGWIVKLDANQEGMHVHKGQPLFDLYSPDLQVAAEELIAAAQALGKLDSNASDAVKAESQNLVASARRKLQLLGVADQDIDRITANSKAPQTITFRSPADGDIVEKTVVEGASVQAGMKAMRIEDHSRLWLEASVYEQQIAQVKPGVTLEATVDALPGQTFRGPITLIYPHLDETTRSVKVRATLENPNDLLKPGMYASAAIDTQPVADALLAPREAVIDTGSRQFVFLPAGRGHFIPRDVRLGIAGDHDLVQILGGLSPGDTVVTSGQFLMDVESRTTEALQKLGVPKAE